jgi:hypothetical protein
MAVFKIDILVIMTNKVYLSWYMNKEKQQIY